MIRKEKMINKKLIAAGMIAGLVLIFSSCRNLFSQKNSKAEEADSITVSGTICTNDTITVNNTISSRYAIPGIPEPGVDVWYTITAYRGNIPKEGTVTIDSTTHAATFSVNLSQGTWILVARGYNSATVKDSTTQILEGKSEPIVIDGSSNKFKTGINITTEPLSKEAGSVNLEIKVYSSINTIIAEWQQQVSGVTTTLKQVLKRGTDFTGPEDDLASASFTMKDTPAGGGSQVNQTIGSLTSVPAGIYDIKINFYTEEYSEIGTSTRPVYTIPKETVYVYKNLTTTTWHNNNDGKIEITDDIIAYNIAHTFYVKFNTTETIRNGSYMYPFTTLQAAVNEVLKVNDGGNYTICLLDDFTESASTGSYSVSDGNKGTLVKIVTETGKPLKLKICSDSDSDKRTVNINRSSTNNGGIFYLNGGAANLYLTLENLILRGAYSAKTGGVIGMENATASGDTFTGARVTIKNCIIRDNTTKSDSGGAIFVSKHNSLSAYDTTFYNNQTYHSDGNYSNAYGNGGAIYAYGGTTIDGCIFDSNKTDNISTAADNATENNAAGGAILVNLHSESTNDNQNVIIRNSTFVNNIAKGAGGAVHINTSTASFPLVQFENVVIKNNKSSNTSYAGGIGLGADSTMQSSFSIKGKNQITDNYCSDGAGGVKECNVYLPEDKVITVTGSLTGSSIGITRADASTISGSAGLAITSGYSTAEYNNPSDPTGIFLYDDSSCVVDSALYGNEARIIAVPSQSGSVNPNYDLSKLDISLNRKNISYGQNNVIIVSVFNNNSLLTASQVEMTYTLSNYGGEIVPESTTGGNTPKFFSLDSSNPFMLHFYNKLPKGNYELCVKAYDKISGCMASANYVIQNGEPFTTISQAIADNTTLSAGQVYAIKTQDDFAALAGKVNASSDPFDFAGVTLYMENDITLSDIVTPVGLYSNTDSNKRPFKGTFDGQGNTIIYNDSITFADIDSNNNSRHSLFLYITDGAVIKNVTTKCRTSTAYLTACAGIVGEASGNETNLVIIENCINEANVRFSNNSTLFVGGIVYDIENGIIRNCVNKGIVDNRKTNNIFFTGGICGRSTSSLLYNLRNEGKVTDFDSSTSYNSTAAGIVGYINGGNGRSVVYNCENKGKIMGNYFVAGIIGSGDTTKEGVNVYNCCNQEEVYTKRNADSNVAGLIYKATQTELEIMNNLSAGEIGYNYKVNNYGSHTNGKKPILSIVSISNSDTDAISSHEIFYNNIFTAGEVLSGATDEQMKNISDKLVITSTLNRWVDEQNNVSEPTRIYARWVPDSNNYNKPHLDLGF